MENTNIKYTGKSLSTWVGYGAEFFTLFFALAILSGRVYAQSYWNVFGLTPELIDSALINYAIVSPNVAVASVIMAATTILFLAFLRQQPPDLIGNRNPNTLFYIGFVILWVGLFGIGFVMHVDTSTWTSGTAGLAFGLGYFCLMGGMIVWVVSGLKLEKKGPPKWQIKIFHWLRNVPDVFMLIFFIVVMSATSIWSIMDTAQQFGANEAKFMYNNRPIVELQLDSQNGFEDLPLIVNSKGGTFFKARILSESGGFFYLSTGLSDNKTILYIRAIPVSRVQSIQYQMIATPIGK